MAALSWCISGLQRVAADLSLYEDGRAVSSGTLEAILSQLEIVYRELAAFDALGELTSGEAAALHFTARAIEEVRSVMHSQSPWLVTSCYNSPLIYNGLVGRPSYDIQLATLEFLLESRFTVPQIADILCVSIYTYCPSTNVSLRYFSVKHIHRYVRARIG